LKNIIKPQAGFQEKFLSSPADIAIGGSAAGVGKTWALLADPLRAVSVPKFTGVIFRRNTTQVRNPGGLLDASRELYMHAKGELKETTLDWNFRDSRVSFRHLEYESSIYDWMGSELAYIGFDELTHFTDKMFWYLASRNRSTCGVNPWMRATCNPDPDSWVADLVKWWIDADGFVDKEKEGKLRYFTRRGDDFVWGNTFQEVVDESEDFLRPMIEKSKGLVQYKDLIKSLTLIGGSIYDNEALLRENPQYLGNLLSQNEEDQLRLLGGNWKAKPNAQDIYDYPSFLGCFDNIRDVDRKGKYITADIAMKGSNKFVVGYWEGFELMDLCIMDKSDGKDVINKISDFAKKYSVNNQYICYDADGVGSFVDGFVRGAIPFNGGTPAIQVRDQVSGTKIKENYFNLKTQCYYRSGDRVARGELKINERVATMMYDNTMTVRQRFLFERKAIKRDKIDMDGKLRIIPKEEMKAKLNGESPDLLDMLMMREIFDLKPAIEYSAANY
jgi:hypothetical protein